MRILGLLIWIISISAMIKENDECSISYGFSCRQGLRMDMEDKIIIDHVSDKKTVLAVLDGHCAGPERSKKAPNAFVIASHSLCNFMHTYQLISSKEELITKAFAHAESMIDKENAKGGSTVTLGYFDGKELSMGWLGDSQALLIRDNKIIFKTKNHKPSKKDEELRIESVGGIITNKGSHKDPNSRVIPRIQGFAISRLLGDLVAKKILRGAISPIPDIQTIDIHAGDILLMASDGLWDIYSSHGARLALNNALQEQSEVLERRYNKEHPFEWSGEGGDKKLSLVARCLCNEAYDKGSTDNISVLVAQFSKEKNETICIDKEDSTTELDALEYYCPSKVD